MSSLQNKIDFVALVSVTRANSNGDPLNGNRPRTDLNGFGEISDVCIKRKIRNRMQDLGKPIFVQSEDRCSDGCGSLSERASAAMKGIKDREEYARHACETWLDVRTFGQVFAFTGVARLDSHAQQAGDGLGGLGSLGLVLAVDADVAQLEAQHDINGLAAHCGDLVPGTGLDLVALAHPGAADSDDLVVAQIVVDILGVDTASAHPLAGLEGSADILQLVHAAVGLCGEELNALAAHVHGLLHLAGGGGAGHHDAALVDDVLADLGVKAGGNDEGSAGGHSAVSLINGQDSAGAQQHIGQFLVDLLDALLSTSGAEGDLGGGQAAVHQGLAQGQGLVRAVESNDRDNADLVNTLQNRIHSNSPSLILCGPPSSHTAAGSRTWLLLLYPLGQWASIGQKCERNRTIFVVSAKDSAIRKRA